MASSGLPESRVAILYNTRRWLLLLLLTQAWLFAALVGVLNWGDLHSSDRLALVASALAVVGGWSMFKRPLGLWIILFAPLLLVVAAFTNGGAPSDVSWIALATSTGHVTYALVLLTRPTVGLASIVVGTISLAGIWSMRPGNVVAGGLEIAEGRIQFAALAASAFALWAAWHWLVRRAREEDIASSNLAARLTAEQELQEQSRQWRAATISVHERLLSTLRYLALTDEPDRAGLQQLALKKAGAEAKSDRHAEEELRLATAARLASQVIRLDSSIVDIPISDEVRAALRAAITECALNAVLHGGASDVHASAQMDASEHITVRVSDNGTGIPEDVTPGFGWNSVLDQGLSTVGGTWTVDRGAESSTIVLILPASRRLTTTQISDDGFAQGRLLLTAPLLAIGAVGLAFNALALWGPPLGQIEVTLYAGSIVAGVVFILRGRRLPVVASTAILVALAITPGLTALNPPPLATAVALAAGLVTAGYAIIAIALWCRVWQFICALAIWAGGMIAVSSVMPAVDRQVFYIGMVNCLVIVPIVVVVTSIATRRYRRIQALQRSQREAMRAELVRSHAEAVIDAQLSASVSQAEVLIDQIAHGAELNESCRRELACIEGLLRATIQIDPIASGEFARAASRLCNAAFNRGIPADVGTLISSPDPTPFPLALENALERVMEGADTITVRAINSADEDHIALRVHGAAMNVEAVHALKAVTYESITVDLDEDANGDVIVMVTRNCAAPVSAN